MPSDVKAAAERILQEVARCRATGLRENPEIDLCDLELVAHAYLSLTSPDSQASEPPSDLTLALDLLRELHDFSGEPTSYRNHDRWHEAMNKTITLLKKHGK